MDFRLLGPVEAYSQQRPVRLGRRRERCLLGLLLMEAGNVLTMDRLVALLWNDDPPPAAPRSVHAHVARLRAGLSPHGLRIVTAGTGYLADVDPREVDVHRFTAAVARAQALAHPAERAAVLGDALALWRGPLLAGVAGDELRERVGASVEGLRRLAVELRAQALLDGGAHEQVAAELPAQVAEHPTRERLVELLMVALYRGGRQAEALAVYRRTRELLVADLGVEPGPQLQRTHSRVLVRDPTLAAAPPGDTARPDPPRWRYLPRDIPDFTGRAADLDRLDALVPDGDGSATAVVITTIAGTAGIGKTALAVHWGHRTAGRYPDGQLYVNLRGYDTGRPLRPVEAFAQLLRALGLSGDKIPVAEPEAADLYRSVLADKRVLVLLDNARSVDQVRPLLPSSPGSVAVITSRDRLTGLLARDGARRLTLDVLRPDEAIALLSRILGADRVQAEPAAARELAALCGHLPLALRIAAANLADQPDRRIAEHVTALGEGNVVALAVEGDRQSALRAAFYQSYATLAPRGRRLFRSLGLLPAEDFPGALPGGVRTVVPVVPGHRRRRRAPAVPAHVPPPGDHPHERAVRPHRRAGLARRRTGQPGGRDRPRRRARHRYPCLVVGRYPARLLLPAPQHGRLAGHRHRGAGCGRGRRGRQGAGGGAPLARRGPCQPEQLPASRGPLRQRRGAERTDRLAGMPGGGDRQRRRPQPVDRAAARGRLRVQPGLAPVPRAGLAGRTGGQPRQPRHRLPELRAFRPRRGQLPAGVGPARAGRRPQQPGARAEQPRRGVPPHGPLRPRRRPLHGRAGGAPGGRRAQRRGAGAGQPRRGVPRHRPPRRGARPRRIGPARGTPDRRLARRGVHAEPARHRAPRARPVPGRRRRSSRSAGVDPADRQPGSGDRRPPRPGRRAVGAAPARRGRPARRPGARPVPPVQPAHFRGPGAARPRAGAPRPRRAGQGRPLRAAGVGHPRRDRTPLRRGAGAGGPRLRGRRARLADPRVDEFEVVLPGRSV